MKQTALLFLLTSFIFFQSCKKDNEVKKCTKEVEAKELDAVDQTRLASDIVAIDDYLAVKGITAQIEPHGVRYVITQEGTGSTPPCLESYIKVKYKGLLLAKDTFVFDESIEPVELPLSNLIIGWKLVLPGVKTGSKVTLYIPSGYAYGIYGGGGGKIPSNANLIFDIELVSVR